MYVIYVTQNVLICPDYSTSQCKPYYGYMPVVYVSFFSKLVGALGGDNPGSFTGDRILTASIIIQAFSIFTQHVSIFTSNMMKPNVHVKNLSYPGRSVSGSTDVLTRLELVL